MLQGLGDKIETALSLVGITSERIERYLGAPCGCQERKEKLNALGAWATRVTSGKLSKAKEYLERIIE
jgi:hypothetical protein